MTPQRVPVTGQQDLAKLTREYQKIGRVKWEENPDYRGPRNLNDSKGYEETRGWLVVEPLPPGELSLQKATELVKHARAMAHLNLDDYVADRLGEVLVLLADVRPTEPKE